MKEEFEYGEEVLVREFDNEKWSKRIYVGTIPRCKGHWCVNWPQDLETFDGVPIHWKQIRKIEKDEIKSPEINPTRKEKAQLRDDANWAIEQALTIGHREQGEVVRAAKLIIESRGELIKFMKEGWTE